MSSEQGRGGRVLRSVLKVVVSTALIWFLLRRISIDELSRLVLGLDRTVIVGAVVCFFTSNVLGAAQWHRLLVSAGVSISFGEAFRVYFVGLFFNNFLPANIGGDAVKVYDISRSGDSPYKIIAVTVLDRIIGIFSLCMLATGFAIPLAADRGADPYAWYVLVFLGCMAPALGLYFVRPLGRLIRRIVLAIRPLSLDTKITAVLDHLSEFRARKGLVVRLILFSCVIQSLRVLTHVMVGSALGVPLDGTVVSQFFVFIPLLSLAMIPPITINGLGIREGLGILLFRNAGLPDADAFTLEFLTYVVSVVVSLLGLVFFLGRRRRQAPARDE